MGGSSRDFDAEGKQHLIDRCRILSERVAQHNRRMKAEEQTLGADIDALYRELKDRIKNVRESQTGTKNGDDEINDLLLARKIYEGQGPGGDLRIMSSATKQTPLLLKALLGKETAGVLIRNDQRQKAKDGMSKVSWKCG